MRSLTALSAFLDVSSLNLAVPSGTAIFFARTTRCCRGEVRAKRPSFAPSGRQGPGNDDLTDQVMCLLRQSVDQCRDAFAHRRKRS